MLERFNQAQEYERVYRKEYTDPIDAAIDFGNQQNQIGSR
jgi:hypothetical protein